MIWNEITGLDVGVKVSHNRQNTCDHSPVLNFNNRRHVFVSFSKKPRMRSLGIKFLLFFLRKENIYLFFFLQVFNYLSRNFAWQVYYLRVRIRVQWPQRIGKWVELKTYELERRIFADQKKKILRVLFLRYE